jgi:intein/homing endonuclease
MACAASGSRHDGDVRGRLVAAAVAWWTQVLGFGRNSYEQRVPDLAWEQTLDRKRALLSGAFEGDGSWSLVNGGPSVIIEWGNGQRRARRRRRPPARRRRRRLRLAPRADVQVDEETHWLR